MFKSRYYQEEAIESIFEYYNSGKNGNALICMPTGTGKSYVIAEFNRRVLSTWPNQRILNLTHVKELIENNANTLNKIWPIAPIGIYSAGLGERTTNMPIIFGGIASVKNAVEAFGHRDLVIIDEAHLLSPNESSMYQYVIAKLKERNPFLKVIGLTATPYRLGQGMITDGGLFTDVCYDVTGYEAFNRLIAEGYLVPPIPKPTNTIIDTSQLSMSNGDFAKGQLDETTDKILYEALKECLQYGQERKCWLAFAPGIKTAEHAADILNSFGIPSAAIHSKLTDDERNERIKLFKCGALRCLVNNNVLTTGFDHPPIDFILMLRATMSPGLWVQMLGRGTRPYNRHDASQYIPGFDYVKTNCLVLDFAGNARRLGPINDPIKPRKKGDKTGDAPIKICDQCGCYNHASARTCDFCGYEFPIKPKITTSAGTDVLLRSDMPQVEHYEVNRVIYSRHVPKSSLTPIIKVTYFAKTGQGNLSVKPFNEFINFESSSGYVKHRAHDWWRQRHASEPPNSTDEALAFVAQLRPPKRIRVWLNKQYPEVLSYEY